jgi:Helix-turn-helix domain
MGNQSRQIPGNDRPKPDPSSAADETFLTDEQLAARWQIAPKTLRNARVTGRLIGHVKIGRSVRYRLSEIVAYELQNSKRSTGGGEE